MGRLLKPRKKIPCEFCGRLLDKRGMDCHVHFKHRAEVIRQFRMRVFFSTDPHTRLFVAQAGIGPKLLPPAPTGIT